ncbi:Uncharacterized membrane protein [Micromonospora pattaloongensis]|uniref:Uncharacterized membrane protein n=1 Tax=Micromonospora pattaloongensis TaxID=405436 RepID=A0A1H3SJ66_9ACTN|nr:hypothetical protein [Micromonospora pattaloongensis]SDZ38103.1 Uncharacterized membrane protein [Micromonospora pattaloongensis]
MDATAMRAAVLGGATGARSMTGLAGVALTTRPDRAPGWVGRLGNRWGRGVTATAALGEMLADKSPRIPSRLSPPVLAERITVGAVSAAALARRDGGRPAVAVLLAVAGVVGMSVVGARWRAYAQQRGRTTAAAAALVEDLAAVVLAAAACAPRRRGRWR